MHYMYTNVTQDISFHMSIFPGFQQSLTLPSPWLLIVDFGLAKIHTTLQHVE